MPTLSRVGARISSRRRGEGRGTIVFGHNILCDGRVFDGVIDRLPGHRTIAIDWRGHGESTAEHGYRVRDLSDDLRAVLDAEGIERATLVGLSIGASVAMDFTLRHPSRVERLVAMGCNGDGESTWSGARNLALAGAVRVIGMRGRVVSAALASLFGASFRAESPQTIDLWAERIRRLGAVGAWNAVRAWDTRPRLLPELPGISVPTLVVVGEEDTACPPRDGKRVHRAIRGSKLASIPRAGHTMAAERPAEIANAIRSFLDDWEGSA